MTVPIERRWAITNARQFLWDLLDPKKTPRVPKAIRRRASQRLKHFPTDLDMEDVQRAFGPPPPEVKMP